MNTITLNIIYTVVGAVVTFVLSIIGYKVTVFIDAKVKNTKAAELLKAATNSVLSAVKAANQTYVDSLKKSGSFTAEAQATAFALATSTAKEQMTADTVKAIESTYGNFEAWLKTATEAAVADVKANQ